jgi:hypothetical protein
MNYRIEWIVGPLLLGTVLLPVIVPPFALIGLAIAALAVLAALVALAAAVLATPYLVVRSLRRHLAERSRSTESPAPVARAIPQAALANPATARR